MNILGILTGYANSPAKKKTYIFLGVFAMCFGVVGCATPPVEYRTVEVKVPVPVPCSAAVPQEPVWARNGTSRASNIDELAKAYVSELIQREAYEGELIAAVKGCQ